MASPHRHGVHHAHGAHEMPRRRLRPEWLALVTLAVLAASCASAWALAGSHAKAGPSTARPSALARAIAQANQLGAAAGKLPRGSCAQRGQERVVCTSPAPGVSWAAFETYLSLPALYNAYEERVTVIRHHPFSENYGDCGLAAPGPGGSEVAWNHQFRHPRQFTAAAMSAGRVPVTAAAGRVFCISADGAREEMVWTQDDGRMLGEIAGTDHEAVWGWWLAVHHNIDFSSPMAMAPGG